MKANPQTAFICSFQATKELHFEFIEHQDGHKYLYINGCKIDIYIGRSAENNGSIKWPSNIKELFDIKQHIWYGKSKYNEKIIEDLFSQGFPQYYI